MALLFCEYLLEQNLVNSEQLLEALIEQLRSIPSVSELVYETGLLAKSDLLKIFILQQAQHSDFISSAKSLGLWSDHLDREIQRKIQTVSKPLNEILVQKGFLDLNSISSAFAAYVEENISKLHIENKSPIEIKVENKNIVSNKQATENASSSFIKLGLISEYISSFNGTIYPEIQVIIEQMKDRNYSKDKFKLDIKKLLSKFIAIRAGATLLGANESQRAANETIKFIENVGINNNEFEEQTIIDIFETSASILSYYCKCLKESNSEKGFNEEMKKLIEVFFEKISKKGV